MIAEDVKAEFLQNCSLQEEYTSSGSEYESEETIRFPEWQLLLEKLRFKNSIFMSKLW